MQAMSERRDSRNLTSHTRYDGTTAERCHPRGVHAQIARLTLSEHSMSRNSTDAVNSYITDMLALEEHILTAVQGQQESMKDEHPKFSAVLRDIEGLAKTHAAQLRQLVDERRISAGGAIAGAVKKAGSVVLGAGAAAIDLVRTERVPKNLRDDYTALSLATIGYAMLFTTATSLGEPAVAQIAAAQHKSYAQASMALHHIVPASVVELLMEEGLATDATGVKAVNKELDTHWRS